MKFMLMMHTPRENGDYAIMAWPKAALQAHADFMARFNDELRATGALVSVVGLKPPGEARLVRAGQGGPEVTDGPFAEAKEFLAGYWIVEAKDAAEAYAIAGRASLAPGQDGKPLNTVIEVREVMFGG